MEQEETYTFRMQLKQGMKAEYKKRHDEIWSELVELLHKARISDYAIYFDEKTHLLFGVLKRGSQHKMDDLPSHPIMQKWWAHMADIMETHPNNEPVVEVLEQVFYME